MKKIGILFGMENSFPTALIQRINSMNKGCLAEAVHISQVLQGMQNDYHVIVDRISHDVPFYRAYLKTAALAGTAVLNNPFWNSADEKFFNNSLAHHLHIPVPKTALLPSFQRPPDTGPTSFRNLSYPMDWQEIFNYTGFPAYLKPFSGGGWKHVYRIETENQFFETYGQTHQLVMMLQEEILFDAYFRCYVIGGKQVHTMHYDPRLPHAERYHAHYDVDKRLLKTVAQYAVTLNEYLGYDVNSVEFAVKDGIPYAIDFCNPVPDADLQSVGASNFEWIVNTTAEFAIEKALVHAPGKDNLTWGKYMQHAVLQQPLRGEI
ncbi:hypothetical protein LX64_02400 [Chitinophaga skermanii]|uniref:Glutathione synthase/RimK-type ligase-like ATP-grasp enzyme n=1 Tax=Chitinophaga skermanii TaxID=331697 RepID=A0A327QMZ3_9BACT|nr:hypothetical protein [Chitinophaga skermanii]RAJ05245.1 hypothetical protein LX64_02400 [Chitinophaga skermanii]